MRKSSLAMAASAVIALTGCMDDGGETARTEQEAREAAKAEQPETEARLREVAELMRPDLAELDAEDPRWLSGGTAACTWDGNVLSYVAEASFKVEDPEKTVAAAIEQVPDRWEPLRSLDPGHSFTSEDGYLLAVSYQTSPDYATITVESPCYG